MAVSLTFIVVVLFVAIDLMFIIKPVFRFGLLNLVLGSFTILFALYFGILENVGDLSVVMRWWLALFVAVIGLLTLWRGLSTELSE